MFLEMAIGSFESNPLWRTEVIAPGQYAETQEFDIVVLRKIQIRGFVKVCRLNLLAFVIMVHLIYNTCGPKGYQIRVLRDDRVNVADFAEISQLRVGLIRRDDALDLRVGLADPFQDSPGHQRGYIYRLREFSIGLIMFTYWINQSRILKKKNTVGQEFKGFVFLNLSILTSFVFCFFFAWKLVAIIDHHKLDVGCKNVGASL